MGRYDSAPENIEELKDKNLSATCPFCGDTVMLIPQHVPISGWHGYVYFVALCPNHKRSSCKPIFAVYQTLNDCIWDIYPIPSFEADKLHTSIPLNIREDLAEARRCLYAKSYKGCVVLCRRIVESIAKEKLGDKYRDKKGDPLKLHALIVLLFQEGFITKDISDSTHEIRHFGNYGAHIQDDGLDKVEPDEAQDIKEITEQLLEVIYIAPYQTKKLREKRQEKKAKK